MTPRVLSAAAGLEVTISQKEIERGEDRETKPPSSLCQLSESCKNIYFCDKRVGKRFRRKYPPYCRRSFLNLLSVLYEKEGAGKGGRELAKPSP